MRETVSVTSWTGCYQHGWQPGDVVPEAFAHPAKVAKGLAFRLVKHLLDQGYVQPGQTVLDPFAGIGGFCLPALHYGLRFVGVELEPRFVDLGQQNLALWQRRYGFSGGTVVQGDSRQLRQVLAGMPAGCVVGSPSFCQSDGRKGGSDLYLENRRQTGRNPSSPSANFGASAPYGSTPGQLGALPPGVPPSCVVGSPPFAHIETAQFVGKNTIRDDPSLPVNATMTARHYGTTPGQLGALPPGTPPACVVGSPPYERSLAGEPRADQSVLGQMPRGENRTQGGAFGASLSCTYGAMPDNLGTTTGDTFWSAASTIMAEVAALLPPGGVAAWVVKGYVKDGRLVDFPAQWRALCEAHGFRLVEEIHASLVETYGTQEGLFGETETVQVARKSFFRRLAERKGSPPIDHETILLLTRDAPCATMVS